MTVCPYTDQYTEPGQTCGYCHITHTRHPLLHWLTKWFRR